jgi:hypothetical protein
VTKNSVSAGSGPGRRRTRASRTTFDHCVDQLDGGAARARSLIGDEERLGDAAAKLGRELDRAREAPAVVSGESTEALGAYGLERSSCARRAERALDGLREAPAGRQRDARHDCPAVLAARPWASSMTWFHDRSARLGVGRGPST